MIALGASQTLQGSTTTVTNTTVTVSGLLLDNNSPPGPQGYKELAQLQLGTSVGSIYGPGASNTALLASIMILNTSGSITQTVNLFINGTAGSNQIASFTVPPNGWVQYEDGAGWTVYNSTGIPVTTAATGSTNQAAYFSATNVLSGTALMTFVSGQILANGAVLFQGPVPWYDVKANGCTGNGSTDDSTAFAALLTVVSSAGGGVIYIGAGVNMNLAQTSSAFTVPGGTTVLGVSRAGSIIATPTGSTANTLLQMAATDGYFTITSIQFYSHATQTAGGCINTNGASDILIQDCEFNSGWFNCVAVTGASIKVELEDCNFANGVNAHVLINNGTAGDTYLTRCVFDGSGTCANNVLVNATGHYSILQCNITNGIYGMQVNPGAGQIVNDGFITHTLFDSCGTACLNLNASTSTSTIKGLHFSNAWFSGCGLVSGHTNVNGVGIVTQGVTGGIIDHIVLDACRILNNALHGFNHTFGTDIWLTGGTWVAGNSQSNNPGATTATGDGFVCAATAGSFHIIGCRIGGSDTSDTTSTQRWGINVVTGNTVITTYTYAHNDLRANGVASTVTSGGPVTDNGPSTNITSSTPTFVGKITGPNIGAMGQGRIASTSGAQAITTSEVNVIGAFIPFNSLQVGTVLKVTVWGTSTSTGTAGTCTLSLRFGPTTLTGTVILTHAPATVATAATGSFEWVAYVTINSLSATVASMSATGVINLAAAEIIPAGGITGATPANLGITTTTATLNTTVANILQATAKQTVGSMSLFGAIEVMSP